MDSILKTFSISFLLRSGFSGIFFVISCYVAFNHPPEFSKVDTATNLVTVLLAALFGGVTAYGIHRSFAYPFVEYFLDSAHGRRWRKCAPLIRLSTMNTLLWRWDQDADPSKYDRSKINERLNVWGDVIHFQYTSGHCIILGAIVAAMFDSDSHQADYRMIGLTAILMATAFYADWRHHAFLDYVRNPAKYFSK